MLGVGVGVVLSRAVGSRLAPCPSGLTRPNPCEVKEDESVEDDVEEDDIEDEGDVEEVEDVVEEEDDEDEGENEAERVGLGAAEVEGLGFASNRLRIWLTLGFT